MAAVLIGPTTKTTTTTTKVARFNAEVRLPSYACFFQISANHYHVVTSHSIRF
jgi:hypothetical protein